MIKNLIVGLVFTAAITFAAPVSFNNVQVTCTDGATKNIQSETITFDGVGGFTGGVTTSPCFFNLVNNGSVAADPVVIKLPPFAAGTLIPFLPSFSNNTNTVCNSVGFCQATSSQYFVDVAPVVGGTAFTLHAGSITTTFTLGTGGLVLTPEPSSAALVSAAGAMLLFGLARRRRVN